MGLSMEVKASTGEEDHVMSHNVNNQQQADVTIVTADGHGQL